MSFSSVVQPDDFSFSLSIPLKPLPVITIPSMGSGKFLRDVLPS